MRSVVRVPVDKDRGLGVLMVALACLRLDFVHTCGARGVDAKLFGGMLWAHPRQHLEPFAGHKELEFPICSDIADFLASTTVPSGLGRCVEHVTGRMSGAASCPGRGRDGSTLMARRVGLTTRLQAPEFPPRPEDGGVAVWLPLFRGWNRWR